MITLLLVLLQVPTDKDAEAAVKTFRAALKESSADDTRIGAARDALEVRHEKVVRSVAEMLTTETSEKVRIGVALAMGDSDHPACVDALTGALSANEKKPMVLGALAQGLGTLGFEAAAPKLNEYVKKVGDPEVREALPAVIEAIGQIGSTGSIDPLVDLLKKLQTARRDPWPNEGRLIQACRAALKAITGEDAGNGREFEDWWKANKGSVLGGAKTTYWLKKTQERITQPATDKAPADSIVVGTRVTDPPAPKGEGKDPKKKKKKQ